MAKIEQKVKTNPLRSKTKVNPFRMNLRHFQRGFRPFEPFFKKCKIWPKLSKK